MTFGIRKNHGGSFAVTVVPCFLSVLDKDIKQISKLKAWHTHHVQY